MLFVRRCLLNAFNTFLKGVKRGAVEPKQKCQACCREGNADQARIIMHNCKAMDSKHDGGIHELQNASSKILGGRCGFHWVSSLRRERLFGCVSLYHV